MDTEGVIQIIILILLLILSAFFSSAETALTGANKVRLEALFEEGKKNAATALSLLENRSKMLSAILIMNNIINLSASALTTTLAYKYFGSSYIAVATGLLTFVLLIFGEITPKSLATIKSEELSLSYAGVINLTVKILTPVIFLVDKISSIIIRMFGVDPNESRAAITEYELRSIVETSHEDGVIESEEREMINNVVDFGDSCAKDVMIPRVDMACVSIDASFEELKSEFFEKRYTRFPVYEESTDNIVGILNMKDVLFYENHEGFSLKLLMREPSFTFEYKKTSELFKEMRQNLTSMVFVLDEYGATVGLITLEDLLEEIVGEIRDEYDEDEKDNIKEISEREFSVDGSMKLDDINDALNSEFTSDEYDSIGGFVIEKLDHIPEPNEVVVLDDGTEIKVVSMEKNHIERVELLFPERKNDEENEEDAE